MLDDLPKAYNVVSKRNSKGNTSHWIGYKLHIDQQMVVFPLAAYLAQLMMSQKFISTVKKLGHIPIIDINPRWNKSLQLELKAGNKRCRIIN